MTDSQRLDLVAAKRRSPVQSAFNDPFGARLVLLTYGELAEYPDISVGPVQLKNGKEGWTKAINAAQPLWLGVAWQRIELFEYQLQQERDKIEAIKANVQKHVKEDQMPVVQWTDTAGGLEPGTYSVVVSDITEEEGNFGPQLRFQFVVLDDEGDETDAEIRGWCSQKWGAKTKLLRWSKSILGKKCPGENQALDTDKLLKKKCDIVVSPRKKQDGTMGTGIEDVFPYRTVNALGKDDSETDIDTYIEQGKK